MLPLRLPPPRTRALPRRGPVQTAITVLAALSVNACFKDDGITTTSQVAVTSSSSGAEPGTSSSTADPTTSTTGTDEPGTSTGAVTPTTGTGTDTGTGTGESTGECLDIWYLDIDGDGYGGPETTDGCGPPPPGFTVDSLDCDDTKPKVYPGAPEVCDGLDNDCDLGVDEWPAAMPGECNGCEAQLYLGHLYYFCRTPPASWQDARARCQTLLSDLVIID